jgi:hypothetical protein
MGYNSFECYNTTVPSLPMDVIGVYAPFQLLAFDQGFAEFGWTLGSFTNAAVFVGGDNGDLHLIKSSPQIGTGINLLSLHLPGLTNDIEGHARPTTGQWTMGAYISPPLSNLILFVNTNL